MTVTMQDVRAAKMCARGARAFLLSHGVEWSDFLKNGVSADLLIRTGDAMAMRVVEVARGRQQ
jgi:hypothetical protein